jgi:2-polyprenyl-3-methyl-5-hydroxy-6-metoxy-1,4-benzoquinol methylase
MYSEYECATRWAQLLAPRTGSLREELVEELARYLGIAPDIVRERLKDATSAFADEWRTRVQDPTDSRQVVRFYEESTTELFDLAEWHASDLIHLRTLVCLDVAAERGAKTVLDYGSGIGSDAVALASAGFDVTLADVSGPLLAFARWRCQNRGLDVRTIDLKKDPLPRQQYDAVLCFDVLEHVPNPVATLRRIRRSMRSNGLLFVHAPFGADEERPMHIVKKDVAWSWMRAIGFEWCGELEKRFPGWLWAPHVYESVSSAPIDRVGYCLHDVLLPGRVTRAFARLYRRLRPNASKLAGTTSSTGF